MEHVKPSRNKATIYPGLMVACCVVMLAGVAALYLLGMSGNWGFFALVLMCPLLHLLIMKWGSSKDNRGE